MKRFFKGVLDMAKLIHSKRKVNKADTSVTWLILGVLIFNTINVGFTHDLIIDLGIILFIISVTMGLRNYLVGHQYTFYDYSEINYKKIIFETLREYGLDDYIYDEGQKSKQASIRFKDHLMEVEIELYKKFPTAEPYVMLSFKRWRKRALRDSIIEKLEVAMRDLEDPKPRKWLKPSKIAIVCVVGLFLIIWSNTYFLRSIEGNIYPLDGLPKHITITQLDRNISEVKHHKEFLIDDAAQIEAFYEPYRDIETRYTKDVDIESSIMEYYYIVSLDEPWKTLYVGTFKANLSVDYELMKADSGWKRPMVWLHQLFSGEKYATYSVFTVHNSEAIIKEILTLNQ